MLASTILVLSAVLALLSTKSFASDNLRSVYLAASSATGYWTHTYYSDAGCATVNYVQTFAMGVCFPSSSTFTKYVYTSSNSNSLVMSINTYSDSLCATTPTSVAYTDTLGVCGSPSSGTYPKSSYVSGSTPPAVTSGYTLTA